MRKICLYKITNLLNDKVYVGQTINAGRRWSDHKWLSKKKPEQYIHRAMNKYGIKNFQFEVIAECKSSSDANETEKQLIIQYDSRNPEKGYNLAPGGETAWNTGLPAEQQPMYGKHHSEESRKKISESNIGKLNPHTEEWKEKVSSVLIGHAVSDETKEKIRNSQINKCKSENTKKRMSDAHKKLVGEKHPKAKLTNEQIVKIREEYAIGNISQKDLGVKYGVSQPIMFYIVNNKTYKQ
jgi:group I intron endonuclease